MVFTWCGCGLAFNINTRILAENAGHSHVDAITALYAAHQKGEKSAGIDVDAGPVTRRSDKELYIPKRTED